MESGFDTYMNSRYMSDRDEKQLITIKLDNSVTSKIYNLVEPITIDKLSDIYLDSFISNNIKQSNADHNIIILGIKEFNIKSVSNDAKYNNKIIIPNTNGVAASVNTTIAHRATKFNFVANINPTKLRSLEISLTNDASTPAAWGSGEFWVTFMIVPRK
tara:strand:- start:66 stop:542 length:477 start_codon:yes stop_codon:yes gene_type:complete